MPSTFFLSREAKVEGKESLRTSASYISTINEVSKESSEGGKGKEANKDVKE